jgi:hypothetical protein
MNTSPSPLEALAAFGLAFVSGAIATVAIQKWVEYKTAQKETSNGPA